MSPSRKFAVGKRVSVAMTGTGDGYLKTFSLVMPRDIAFRRRRARHRQVTHLRILSN